VLSTGHQPSHYRPNENGNEEDQNLARPEGAIGRCACTKDEENQGKEGEGELDVLAIDLLSEYREFKELSFH